MEESQTQVSKEQEDYVVKNTETRNFSENNLEKTQIDMGTSDSTVHPVLSDNALEVGTTTPSHGNKDISSEVDTKSQFLTCNQQQFEESGTEMTVSSQPGKNTTMELNSSSCEDLTKADLCGTQSESSSLGMEMLFDEGSPSDTSFLGLVELFDETIQARDAGKWKKNGKNTKKLSRKERKRLKRKLSGSRETEDETVESEDNEKKAMQKKKKPRKLAPNYFIAVRVSNPEIHASLTNAQKAIVEHDLKLKPALVPLGTLHLTLMVMYLQNKDEIEKAKSVLHGCKDDIMPLLYEQQLTMNFTGLDHFGNEVLYSKVADQDQVNLLKSVAAAVRERFAKAGIYSTDDREFQPHLTVMKLSRNPKLRKKGIKKIPKESYSEFIDEHFGVENACALHLCSMVHKKTEDGFYLCIETANFSSDCNSVEDDCSPLLEATQKVKEAAKSVGENNKLLDVNNFSGKPESSKAQVDHIEDCESKNTN